MEAARYEFIKLVAIKKAKTWRQSLLKKLMRQGWEREGRLDKIFVMVEVTESIFFDEMKKQRKLVDQIKKRLSTELGISVDVKLVEKKSLERFEGKAERVIDKRKL